MTQRYRLRRPRPAAPRPERPRELAERVLSEILGEELVAQSDALGEAFAAIDPQPASRAVGEA
jgi:hypothetical protein